MAGLFRRLFGPSARDILKMESGVAGLSERIFDSAKSVGELSAKAAKNISTLKSTSYRGRGKLLRQTITDTQEYINEARHTGKQLSRATSIAEQVLGNKKLVGRATSFYGALGTISGASTGYLMGAYGSDDPSFARVASWTVAGALGGRYVGRAYGASRFRNILPDAGRLKQIKAAMPTFNAKLTGINNDLRTYGYSRIRKW